MTTAKTSYTIVCPSAFRDAVLALAGRRQVNAADLARSLLLAVPPEVLDTVADPGDPAADDRETVALARGRLAGKTMARKPRLQVRLPAGHSPLQVRKALNLALMLDAGTMSLAVGDPTAPPPVPDPEPPPPPPPDPATAAPEPPPVAPDSSTLAALREEVVRLRTVVSTLAFEPLPDGVTTRAEALHVLGFPPMSDPDARELRGRFRVLATIHHPDSAFGDHDRMSQLNAAMDLLRRR